MPAQASVATAQDGKQPARAERGVINFTTQQRDTIVAILSNEKHGFGVRAGMLLRMSKLRVLNSRQFGFSLPARLLYMHLAQFVGVDSTRPRDQVCVSLKTIASWLGRTERYASDIVNELTRSGPLPLLLQEPGRPGRASVYTFVRNPFTVAEQQRVAAAATRRTRHPRVVKEQLAVFAAEGAGIIDSGERDRKARRAQLRREWALPTRGDIKITEAPSPHHPRSPLRP